MFAFPVCLNHRQLSAGRSKALNFGLGGVAGRHPFLLAVLMSRLTSISIAGRTLGVEQRPNLLTDELTKRAQSKQQPETCSHREQTDSFKRLSRRGRAPSALQ